MTTASINIHTTLGRLAGLHWPLHIQRGPVFYGVEIDHIDLCSGRAC